MPRSDPAFGGGGQDREGDTPIFLKLHALSVFRELQVAPLNCERRVVVLAVGSEESTEHGFVEFVQPAIDRPSRWPNGLHVWPSRNSISIGSPR